MKPVFGGCSAALAANTLSIAANTAAASSILLSIATLLGESGGEKNKSNTSRVQSLGKGRKKADCAGWVENRHTFVALGPPTPPTLADLAWAMNSIRRNSLWLAGSQVRQAATPHRRRVK